MKLAAVVKSVPPLAASYHWMLLPVAVKSATVGMAALQNGCAAVPVGADGVVFTVAVTSNRDVLSQLLVVWLA